MQVDSASAVQTALAAETSWPLCSRVPCPTSLHCEKRSRKRGKAAGAEGGACSASAGANHTSASSAREEQDARESGERLVIGDFVHLLGPGVLAVLHPVPLVHPSLCWPEKLPPPPPPPPSLSATLPPPSPPSRSTTPAARTESINTPA